MNKCFLRHRCQFLAQFKTNINLEIDVLDSFLLTIDTAASVMTLQQERSFANDLTLSIYIRLFFLCNTLLQKSLDTMFFL